MLIREFVGPVVAGLVYLFLTATVLLGIYTAASNWNIPYTAGFVVTGLVLLWLTPSVISELVPPVFVVLGTLLVVVFLVGFPDVPDSTETAAVAVPALPSVFILPKGVRRSRERATSRSS